MLVDITRLAEGFNMRFQAKPGKLDTKDANLVFYVSVYPLLNTLQTSDYYAIFYFCVDLASLATSFKKCIVIMT